MVVLTAAMCAGNKLDRVREDFPDRFFDTGICEAHAVAFAAGMAKAGLKPIAAIYSTFLQRSFDQIFQEVALQGLPVTFCLDRSGLCADPTDPPTTASSTTPTSGPFPGHDRDGTRETAHDVEPMLDVRSAARRTGCHQVSQGHGDRDHRTRDVTDDRDGNRGERDSVKAATGVFLACGTLLR